MSRSLLISVRFAEGRYHGTEDRFEGAHGWPPSPARLFQALVAGASKGNKIDDDDRRAFEWLETLRPPRLAAPPTVRGREITFYVPNNDLDAKRGDPSRIGEIRDGKTWRPCLFDASLPVVYVWDFEGDPAFADIICVVVRKMYQLGRGIDMAWAEGAVVSTQDADAVLANHPGPTREPGGDGFVATPRDGTFRSLIIRQAGRRNRLRPEPGVRGGIELFGQPPKALFAHVGYDSSPRRLQWEIRDQEGRFSSKPLDRVVELVSSVRDAAAERLMTALPEEVANVVERVVIGRGAGVMDLSRRVRIVPVPSIGMAHADHAVRRILVEVPHNCPIQFGDLRWAFSGLMLGGIHNREPGRGDFLVSGEDSGMFDRLAGTAQEFRTVTPIAISGPVGSDHVLDPERSGRARLTEETRARAAVVQAIRHAGIKSKPINIRVQKEPFEPHGTLASEFARNSRFSSKSLWHASIYFSEPVNGPVVLGNGRFLGLGVMRPVNRLSGVFAARIVSGLTKRSDPGVVAAFARRAMMSKVQENLGPGRALPRYITGHERDGAPSRGGRHKHVFVVADLVGQRLLWISPHLVYRGGGREKELRDGHSTLERALWGLRDLRAGAAGRLSLAPEALDRATDPMFAAARTWQSTTDYAVTRHARGMSDEEALEVDLRAELQRHGWPMPESVEILDVSRGPRGGLSGQMTIAFSTAQEGPLLLGKTAHKGGGLFRAVAVQPQKDGIS